MSVVAMAASHDCGFELGTQPTHLIFLPPHKHERALAGRHFLDHLEKDSK